MSHVNISNDDLSVDEMIDLIRSFQKRTIGCENIELGLARICHAACHSFLYPNLGYAFLRNRELLTHFQVSNEGCWYPPESPSINQGRFNKEGQSMAYFCIDRKTALMEVFGEVTADAHTLRAVVNKDGLKVVGIFPIGSPNKFRENPFHGTVEENLEKVKKKFSDATYKKVEMATIFLGQEVSRVIEDGDYFLTNLIGHVVFKLFGVDGIVYASTKTDLVGVNVVLKPTAADEYLRKELLVGIEHNNGRPLIKDCATYRS